MDRINQLISDYLDGQLAPDEARELAGYLEQDKVLRDEFIELYRMHRLLGQECSTTPKLNFAQRALANLKVNVGIKNRDFASGVLEELRLSHQPAGQEKTSSGFKRPTPLRTSEGQNVLFRLFGSLSIGRGAAVAGAVLLIIVGCLFAFQNEMTSAVVTKAGVGSIVMRGGKSLSCYDGLQLRFGDTLRSPANGTTEIKYNGERTTLVLASGTQLHFQKSRHGKLLSLETGEISVVAGHQPANAPMIFVTPQAEARVVGTRFQLAARRYSTWLQVAEGAVAFKRHSNGSDDRGSANPQSGPNQVVVKAGEYAVAADGVPLETYQVTDNLNLNQPLPVKIHWFDYYGEPNWYVYVPNVRQVQPTSSSRTFNLSPIKGSMLISAAVTVNSVKNNLTFPQQTMGFGVGLSAGSNYFLACVQNRNNQPWLELADLSKVPLLQGQPVLNVSDADLTSLAEGKLPVSAWPGCKVKFALERVNEHEAIVKAKAWSGDDEPKNWQLSVPISLHETSKPFELRLVTLNAACSFQNIAAFLTE